MPNRILRDGILTSPKIAKLGWAEEVLYRRLMSLVDDYGRYYADLSVLRGHTYPRQLSKVSDSDVGKWLHSCEVAGLVRVYSAQDGERYLEIVNFGQQIRATKSKYPQPIADENICNQLLANAHLDVSVSVDVSVDGFDDFYRAYPKKVGKPAAHKAWKSAKVKAEEVSAILGDIATRSQSRDWLKDDGQFIPNPATYLNQRRWEDQPQQAQSNSFAGGI